MQKAKFTDTHRNDGSDCDSGGGSGFEGGSSGGDVGGGGDWGGGDAGAGV